MSHIVRSRSSIEWISKGLDRLVRGLYIVGNSGRTFLLLKAFGIEFCRKEKFANSMVTDVRRAILGLETGDRLCKTCYVS